MGGGWAAHRCRAAFCSHAQTVLGEYSETLYQSIQLFFTSSLNVSRLTVRVR